MHEKVSFVKIFLFTHLETHLNTYKKLNKSVAKVKTLNLEDELDGWYNKRCNHFELG